MTQTTLTKSQQEALDWLDNTSENLFITGSAGTGKSFLINEWLGRDSIWDAVDGEIQVIASTGAAAVLVGGITFHSFFGLGLAKETDQIILERVGRNPLIYERIQNTALIILDEISMIPGRLLGLASEICKDAMNNDMPFGDIRIVCVGDFHQLPPISSTPGTDWAFLHPSWEEAGIQTCLLTEVMRTTDEEFMRVLEDIRSGHITPRVTTFMNEHIRKDTSGIVGTRLYSKRDKVGGYNMEQLGKINKPVIRSVTKYKGEQWAIKKLKKSVPFDEQLLLKEGALVMLRKNAAPYYVNGTLARVERCEPGVIYLNKLGKRGAKPFPISPCRWDCSIQLSTEQYHWHGADGKIKATATNFPLSLAWAQTIHKAQGASIDSVIVDIKQLWEAGHAYVALSRATDPARLWIEAWSARRVLVDKQVVEFYEREMTA